MRSIVVASVALTLARTVAAQPAPTPPPQAPEQPPYQTTALMLSFCGSLAAWGTLLIGAQYDHGRNAAVPLGAIATMFAPSFGQWYAGEPFSRGFRTRLIGAGAMITAAIPAIWCEDECHPSHVLEVAIYTGVGLYLFGTLDDIVTAPDAARTAQSRRNVALAPMIRRGGSGLVLTGRF